MRILHVASENGALPGGKVGGIGDVLRDLPRAQAALGDEVTVLTPAYGALNLLPGATALGSVDVLFAGRAHTVEIVQVRDPDHTVTQLVLEHPGFAPGGPGRIYHDDGPDRPFATDAQMFAFFSAAASAIIDSGRIHPDIVHLHDWHTALLLALRRFAPGFDALRQVPVVYTIHNLAYQGIRPFAGDASSFEAWFPGLNTDRDVLRDPRYGNCVNPMATAIRLADRIGTVSPTYAREILKASEPARGFFGGEGLEDELGRADRDGRLIGILNGCDYTGVPPRRPAWRRVVDIAAGAGTLPGTRPGLVMTSISRLTPQKSALFLEPVDGYPTALQAILADSGEDALFVMLGSGDQALEKRFRELAAKHRNFVLLCGYSEALSQALYAAGDLYLMPSSFEPCGISQMLAMRAGQPCVAHAVGGLCDTISDGVSGFVFGGETPREQAGNFVACTRRARELHAGHPGAWRKMRSTARAQRFSWERSAAQYAEDLYADARR